MTGLESEYDKNPYFAGVENHNEEGENLVPLLQDESDIIGKSNANSSADEFCVHSISLRGNFDAKECHPLLGPVKSTSLISHQKFGRHLDRSMDNTFVQSEMCDTENLPSNNPLRKYNNHIKPNLLKRNSIIRLYEEDDDAVTNLWNLIGEGFQLRQEVEQKHATQIPDLDGQFPVLSRLMKLCGLLRARRGIFSSRLPWTILLVLVNIVPYILSSVLPHCKTHCDIWNKFQNRHCGLCTSTLSDSPVNGYHTVAFCLLALFLGRTLAWTLYETTTACKVKAHQLHSIRLRYTLGSFAVSIVWWALVPLIGLAFPGFVSFGDVVVGISALIRAPFAATLSAAVLGGLMLVMTTLTMEMKGIRAASKVGIAVNTESDNGSFNFKEVLSRQLLYTSTLHAAYHHANMVVQQAAVSIQVLILAFFCLAINSNLACLFVVFTGRWSEVPDYATVLMIGNTIVLNLFALVLCGFAAHITSITDSTIRSVQNQFSFAIADILSKAHNSKQINRMDNSNKCDLKENRTLQDEILYKETLKSQEDQELQKMMQQISVLNDLLAYAKEAGGFRILGQRITYSFFLIAFTALLGVANLFLSRIKLAD